MTDPPILNLGYRSTNYWVIGNTPARLLVDLGWPGTLGTLEANLSHKGVPIHELRYALATHYHVDHAGLAQELKNQGVTLLVMDFQLAAIPEMKKWMKPGDHYVDILPEGNLVITAAESRKLLREIGLSGEIVATPGHTDHCASLLLDNGAAFTGDLPPENLAFDNPTALASWKLLRDKGARIVYPGHGPVRPLL